MAKRAYYREPETATSLRERTDALLEAGIISDALATGLYIAIDHQAAVDYDGMAEEYDETSSDELKSLLEDTGVVILMTEEQTRLVKYGV